MNKPCGAKTSSWRVMCSRPGKYDGRCWQHRRPDPAVAREKRQADFAAMEHKLDVQSSRSRFIALALEHGLKAKVTVDAFNEFRRFVFAKT